MWRRNLPEGRRIAQSCVHGGEYNGKLLKPDEGRVGRIPLCWLGSYESGESLISLSVHAAQRVVFMFRVHSVEGLCLLVAFGKT